MDSLLQQKEDHIIKLEQPEAEFQVQHVHNVAGQGFDIPENEEALREKEAGLYAALNETCESFIPKKGATEPVPPVRYQTPSKGKKGKNKRIEDEKRLSDLKKEKDIAEVVNHRGMRVVEKMKGTYEANGQIAEQPALKVRDVVASCIKWVPSPAMAEEKYLADHAEDVKNIFRESMYLEEAMQVPEYKDYFANMDPIQKQLIEANLDAMKGLRKLMKAKLLTMGVVLDDADYENITADYLTAENASPQQIEKANEQLSDAKYAYIANNYRLRSKTSRLKKQLDAKNAGQELSQHEMIRNRAEDKDLITDLKGKISSEVNARFQAKGRTTNNTRYATSTAAWFVAYTNMDFKEAVDMAESLQMYEYINDTVKPATRKERKQFAQAVEKVFSVINSYDRKLSDKIFSGDGFLSCSQEEYNKLRFPSQVAFDFNYIADQYGILLHEHPDNCALNEEQYVGSHAMKDSLQVIHGMAGAMESLYGSKAFSDKNVTIDDFRSVTKMDEALTWATAIFADIPHETQVKEGIDISSAFVLNGVYRENKPDDFERMYKDDSEKVKKKYQENLDGYKDKVKLAKEKRADQYAKTAKYKDQAINKLTEKEKEAKEQGKGYTRREHLSNIESEDLKRREAYHSEVSKAVQEKLGLAEVSGGWRYAISTASSYGISTGAPFDEVVDMAITLNFKGKSKDEASPEEQMQFAAVMDRILDHIDKTDLTLLEKGGTDAQFELSDEEHLLLRGNTKLAMDMDPLMDHYEKLLTLHPEYCGRTDKEYMKSLGLRNVLTSMQQQVAILDQLYANEYFEKNIPFERLQTMTVDDLQKEMAKIPNMQLPPEEVAMFRVLLGNALYLRGGIQEGEIVPGNMAETMKIINKKALESFNEKRADVKKKLQKTHNRYNGQP